MMLGDRIEDIMAANACGIASVGVAQSHHTVNDLVDSGATLAFQNFIEVAKTPERIWSLLGLPNGQNSHSGTIRT
jgi:phosphoglycolate phosphatase-like HAD superfamily hydrolase